MKDSADFNFRECVLGTLNMFLYRARQRSVSLELRWDERLPIEIHDDPLVLKLDLLHRLAPGLNSVQKGPIVLHVTRKPVEIGAVIFQLHGPAGVLSSWEQTFTPCQNPLGSIVDREFDREVIAKLILSSEPTVPLAQNLIADFLRDSVVLVDQLTAAIRMQDWERVSNLNCSLKGWCITLGLSRFRVICEANETEPELLDLVALQACWGRSCEWLRGVHKASRRVA